MMPVIRQTLPLAATLIAAGLFGDVFILQEMK
jgi:hypothetical protein